jgi:hypothetical protein
VALYEFRVRFPIARRRVHVNSCLQGPLSVEVEAAAAARDAETALLVKS